MSMRSRYDRTRIHLRVRPSEAIVVGAELQDSRSEFRDDDTPIDTTTVGAAELLRA